MGRHQLSAQVDPESCTEPSVHPPSLLSLNSKCRERRERKTERTRWPALGRKKRKEGFKRERDNEKESGAPRGIRPSCHSQPRRPPPNHLDFFPTLTNLTPWKSAPNHVTPCKFHSAAVKAVLGSVIIHSGQLPVMLLWWYGLLWIWWR